jgi:cell pole-organizing protein PopZ
MLRTLRILATASAFVALGGVASTAGAQDKPDKPVTLKQIGKNIRSETHRAAARTQDAVRKAGNQTEKQAQRTGKSAARVVSRDARNGDYSKFEGKAPLTSGADPLPSPSVNSDKPVTPKQVGKNVQSETHRAGNNVRDAAHNAGKQTQAQAHRTGKSLKKLVSRKARKGDS